MEYPLFLESMIPTTASVFVADISVSERRKGVRHQLCWLWWPVTAKLMIAACLYSFYTFHSTSNTESSSTYRRPTWEPRLLARLRTRPRPRHRVLWSACYVAREQLHTPGLSACEASAWPARNGRHYVTGYARDRGHRIA